MNYIMMIATCPNELSTYPIAIATPIQLNTIPFTQATATATATTDNGLLISVKGDYTVSVPWHILHKCPNIITHMQLTQTIKYNLKTDICNEKIISILASTLAYIRDETKSTILLPIQITLLEEFGVNDIIFKYTLNNLKPCESYKTLLTYYYIPSLQRINEIVKYISETPSCWRNGTTKEDYKNYSIHEHDTKSIIFYPPFSKINIKKYIISKKNLKDSDNLFIGKCYTLYNMVLPEVRYIIINSDDYKKYDYIAVYITSEILVYFTNKIHTPSHYLQMFIIKNNLDAQLIPEIKSL